MRVEDGGPGGMRSPGRTSRVDRRGGGDEPLVVEERATEGRLEEGVLDRVLRVSRAVQVLVDRQRLGVVDAHREAHGVAAGDIAVLFAAVELVLLMVEAVDDVSGA